FGGRCEMFSLRASFGVVLAFLAIGMTGSVVFPQTGQNFGELVGKVTDDQGAVLPGVTVTLSVPAVMGTQTAVTNDRGAYRFPAGATGRDHLRFLLTGFLKFGRAKIHIPVPQGHTVVNQQKCDPL